MKQSKETIKRLLQQQAPQFASLELSPVEKMGHDNDTWRLGDTMTVRLPTGKQYAKQAQKEQKWLPYLEKGISLQIPRLVKAGCPSALFAYPWGIYQWIEGETLDSCKDIDATTVAIDLANFLNELHAIDCHEGPVAGAHNFYRGGPLETYHQEVVVAIEHLASCFNKEVVLAVWSLALSSSWQKKPVWVHGDLVVTNMLVRNQRLSAIIDFGILGIGDPACDLAMYWTYFKESSRNIFKEQLHVDQDTWNRGQGWVLWKALITFDSYLDKTTNEALFTKHIIDTILNEYSINK